MCTLAQGPVVPTTRGLEEQRAKDLEASKTRQEVGPVMTQVGRVWGVKNPQAVAALHPEAQVRAVTTPGRVAMDLEVKLPTRAARPAPAAIRVPAVSPAQEAHQMWNAPLTIPFASS